MAYIDSNGNVINAPKPGTPEAQAAFNGQPPPPDNPFDINSQAYKNLSLNPNPFQAGTQQYSDFNNSQIKNVTNMAGAPNGGQGPQWQSLIDPDTGAMKSQYSGLTQTPGSIKFSNLTPQIASQFGSGTDVNKDPLHNLENYASSTDQSPWLKQALSNNTQSTTNAVNTAAQTGAGNTAAAQSQVAMRGGLSGGAGERIATAGQAATDAGMQNASNTGLSNAGNLNLQEQAQKFGAMSALPGQEIASIQPEIQKQEYLGNTAQAQQSADLGAQQFNTNQNTQAQQYNINNALNQIAAGRANSQNNYNQQMAAWGAGQSANAQGGGGKK